MCRRNGRRTDRLLSMNSAKKLSSSRREKIPTRIVEVASHTLQYLATISPATRVHCRTRSYSNPGILTAESRYGVVAVVSALVEKHVWRPDVALRKCNYVFKSLDVNALLFMYPSRYVLHVSRSVRKDRADVGPSSRKVLGRLNGNVVVRREEEVGPVVAEDNGRVVDRSRVG